MNGPLSELQSRYRGCLLGGAVGDALGYPIEFWDEQEIYQELGRNGIMTLEDAGMPARFSDDTQMTLFACNGILFSMSNGVHLRDSILTAYQEWLGTQMDTSRMTDPMHPRMWLFLETALHALRAPGNTCLNALRGSSCGGTMEAPLNHSKGCGTIMRAAPYGLFCRYTDGMNESEFAEIITRAAATDGALTHGHPAAWYASSALALVIAYITQLQPVHSYRLEEAVAWAMQQLPEAAQELLSSGMQQAVSLAMDASVSDLDGIHTLGKGWVADEALYIAIFCAVRYQDDFAAAIRASVNHRGDSDSTGAVCGNILGAWCGEAVVAAAFTMRRLELHDLIVSVADDLYRAVNVMLPSPGMDTLWDKRYRRVALRAGRDF